MSILKQGEINAIMNNFEVVEVDGKKEARIGKNSIHLTSSHEHRVSLRTNGLVVYGVYYHGEQKIRFTHDFMRYPKPFVKCDDYIELKQVVLDAWKKTFDAKAQAKLNEVKVIVQQLLKQQEETIAKHNAQEPQVTQTENKIEETRTETIEKKEVKEMKSKLNDVLEQNAMQLAHTIRKELKLEGHYHVQMKIALTLAWEVKKGETSIEVVLNNKATKESAEQTKATDTYNAENYGNKEEYNNAEETEETAEETVEKTVEESFRLYLASFQNGVAHFVIKRMSDGAIANFLTKKARNIRNLDEIVGKEMGTVIANCPKNTVVEYYGQYSYLSVFNNAQLKALAESKGIRLVQGTAPSGDAA